MFNLQRNVNYLARLPSKLENVKSDPSEFFNGKSLAVFFRDSFYSFGIIAFNVKAPQQGSREGEEDHVPESDCVLTGE